MRKKICIALSGVLLVAIVGANIFGAGWIFYHDGPYRGKVVDADTGQPIEGAAVLGEWHLETYASPGGPVGVYCDVQETLTDKNGEFVVPTAWCLSPWPFTKMGRPAGFVIFKPGYEVFNNAPFVFGQPLSIFAIGPSTIGYMERGKVTINGRIHSAEIPKSKTYPEGLIFSGEACKERIKSLEPLTNFSIDYFFLPFEGARGKIKKLETPLGCPEDGEAVPHVDQTYNFENDIAKYIVKSFVIVELKRFTKQAKRPQPSITLYYSPDKKIHKKAGKILDLINRERRSLGLQPVPRSN